MSLGSWRRTDAGGATGAARAGVDAEPPTCPASSSAADTWLTWLTPVRDFPCSTPAASYDPYACSPMETMFRLLLDSPAQSHDPILRSDWALLNSSVIALSKGCISQKRSSLFWRRLSQPQWCHLPVLGSSYQDTWQWVQLPISTWRTW